MTGKVFSVVEYTSFYAVRYNPTGEERCMGDGVDVLFDDDDKPIPPGSEGFVEAWEAFLNADTRETLQAYFHTEP